MQRRRFLSVCSLSALSIGLNPGRAIAGSGGRTPRFRVEKRSFGDGADVEVRLVSVGQGADFRRFSTTQSTVRIQHSMDEGAFAIVDTSNPVTSHLSSELIQQWNAVNQDAPLFDWNVNPVFLDRQNQPTSGLDISGIHLATRRLQIRLPMYVYRNTLRTIPKMLVRMHAPGFSKPISAGLTWTGHPFDEQPERRLIRRNQLRLMGEYTFSDEEVAELIKVFSEPHPIEFDFYDADGFGSVEQAEAALPRNKVPLFRIKVSLREGRFHDGLFRSGRLLQEAIEDLREGRGREIEEPCYLTTAACGAVGLRDDCWELQTLRRFRDKVLPSLPGGPKDIQSYYAEAPALLAKLRQGSSARKQLLVIYWQTILPCALLTKVGAHRLCHFLYRRQHRKLMTRYPA